MSPAQQPNPHHNPQTFDSAETVVFTFEFLPADHPEIQARQRERDERERMQRAKPEEKEVPPPPAAEDIPG